MPLGSSNLGWGSVLEQKDSSHWKCSPPSTEEATGWLGQVDVYIAMPLKLEGAGWKGGIVNTFPVLAHTLKARAACLEQRHLQHLQGYCLIVLSALFRGLSTYKGHTSNSSIILVPLGHCLVSAALQHCVVYTCFDQWIGSTELA